MNGQSHEMKLWVARRRAEKAAHEELAKFALEKPRLPKLDCPRCGYRYYELGKSNGQCAVCVTELEHRDSFQMALEDIN